MFDFGFSEILLTSAIALVVLGPERLPKVARQVGNWMGRARAMARQLSEQLEREVNADELLKEQSKKAPLANRIAPPQQSVPSQYVAPDPHTPLPDSYAALPDIHADHPISPALANPAADPHSAPSVDTSNPPNE
jgi:sec-independent protein translocase protein TatB